MTIPIQLVSTALAITIQDWSQLGLGDDPVTQATADRDTVIDRVTALLLIRIVACVSPSGAFPDWGTSSICRTILHRQDKVWPAVVDDKVLTQLRHYVKRMIKGYKDVEYHSFEHAYHVILSANKLIDLMLATPPVDPLTGKRPPSTMRPPTFGLRSDPLALLALIFAAMVHDVEHQGIPNRQLSTENDRLAILYNDQSIAENWSLYVAFSELLQDDFAELRGALFDGAVSDRYKAFRKIVVDLVLQTDIASPERTQIAKSKWKEAFGEPHETVEAKIRSRMRRLSLQGKDINVNSAAARHPAQRRMTGESAYSEITNGSNEEEASPDVTPENSFHEEPDDSGPPVAAAAAPAPPEAAPEALGVQSAHAGSLNRSSGNWTRDGSSAGVGGDPSLESSKLSLNDLLSTTSHSVRAKFDRRQSTTSAVSGRFRQRLGILRTIDLSGESLETYSRHESAAFSSHSSVVYTVADKEADEPDELKSMVVLETILTASDVAHNLQSWDHMVKWSGRLYHELRKAHIDDRGPDVSKNWYENQIGFLESYLLPLARRLEDTGVFGEEVGAQFPRIVEDNRDQWLTDGYEIAQTTIEDGAKKYPFPQS